ncbi:hypothetical protein SGQ44_07840 [Flavobacterium sp. Fl-77]|uniref:Uncharacterized protein n=1 Tax=Flavobacterium flavipigmentatum TaxID=2893884 RepID=A0AAJ2SGJ0_9FLAO|nr:MULTISPECIES: hypothetical protein [unclassified Flavobacterium]MDX6182424.1 hypothetical protein [Flavobacterium sp. Fl-33]MDX6185663.1 hypothetical protein [Flavobacterium sp. Fl-77]UFH38848.1 hypothetical protein LNP22_00890 [Flavobacterium sp. F-70]
MFKLLNDKVGFIGVATAFEDFEFNNEENLKLLLKSGTLIGETKKYYNTNFGLSNYFEKLNFPVAFDSIAPSSQFINSNKIKLVCEAIPNFKNFSEKDKEILMIKIKAYYSQVPLIAETFTINQLQGTPSFIIFDYNKNILYSYFGHLEETILNSKLKELLLLR